MLSIVATSQPTTVWLLLYPDGVSPDPNGGHATILHSLEYGTGALAESFAIHQAFDWLGVAETHADIFAEGEWLTVEQLVAMRTEACDWLEQGRIFAVSYERQGHIARYQLDSDFKPWPVVAEVIRGFGLTQTPDPSQPGFRTRTAGLQQRAAGRYLPHALWIALTPYVPHWLSVARATLPDVLRS